MEELTQWTVEYTDTFGGEANYSWVKRQSLLMESGDTIATLKRAAKKVMGLTGHRGRWSRHGGSDTLEFRPYGLCTVLFVYLVEG